ncbi:MAG TPA: hypothetical protein VKA23_05440, partial [Mariprofundaceae bacterium]|nr:hypothetical protein [Mariprofundaceae bacterium]
PETIRAVVNAVRNLQEDAPADAAAVDDRVVEEQPVVVQESGEAEEGEKPAERKVRHLRVVK